MRMYVFRIIFFNFTRIRFCSNRCVKQIIVVLPIALRWYLLLVMRAVRVKADFLKGPIPLENRCHSRDTTPMYNRFSSIMKSSGLARETSIVQTNWAYLTSSIKLISGRAISRQNASGLIQKVMNGFNILTCRLVFETFAPLWLTGWLTRQNSNQWGPTSRILQPQFQHWMWAKGQSNAYGTDPLWNKKRHFQQKPNVKTQVGFLQHETVQRSDPYSTAILKPRRIWGVCVRSICHRLRVELPF